MFRCCSGATFRRNCRNAQQPPERVGLAGENVARRVSFSPEATKIIEKREER